NVCDSYCLKVVQPILEHTFNLQKQNGMQINTTVEFRARLDTVEKQMATLQGKVSIYEQKLRTAESLKVLHKMFNKIGKKYYYIEEKEEVNWFAAANKCTELGAHLASLQNREEFDALSAMLDPKKRYWIDVNDLAQEGEFRSLTSGRLAPFVKWSVNNPNNLNNGEHCAHLWEKNGSIAMNDEKCSLKMFFTCELYDE
ncbi:hypothetical protein KR222_007527, partial [Zaprionus bogoriensis]